MIYLFVAYVTPYIIVLIASLIQLRGDAHLWIDNSRTVVDPMKNPVGSTPFDEDVLIK